MHDMAIDREATSEQVGGGRRNHRRQAVCGSLLRTFAVDREVAEHARGEMERPRARAGQCRRRVRAEAEIGTDPDFAHRAARDEDPAEVVRPSRPARH